MLPENLRHHRLDVVSACQAADLPILQLNVAAQKRFLPLRQSHVITAQRNFPRFREALGEEVALIDEDTFIPGLNLASLRALPLPGFPHGAGWYFQQLLKFQFCFSRAEDDYYVIWDADTIPLQPLEFFDDRGAMQFTVADEEHTPYFATYRRLLGEEPNREYSFISQQMPVRKSILREMLSRIDTRFPGNENWAWKIMRNLEGTHVNLFSEYEMFGHYVKSHYPEQFAVRRLPWLRDGTRVVGSRPSAEDLDRLGKDYAFAAFEASQRPVRRWIRQARVWLRRQMGR